MGGNALLEGVALWGGLGGGKAGRVWLGTGYMPQNCKKIRLQKIRVQKACQRRWHLVKKTKRIEGSTSGVCVKKTGIFKILLKFH